MLSTRDDGLIDTEQAAMLARVRPGTIRQWVARGHLLRAGLGTRTGINGRDYEISLYRPLDVAVTEKKLRKAARRIIIPRAA